MNAQENKPVQQILIYDPIAFSGGSKKATQNIVNLLTDEPIELIVVTSNPTDWQGLKHYHQCVKLIEPKFLAQAEMGILYFIRHFVLMLQLLIAQARFGQFDKLLATSGPGVDLAMYWMKKASCSTAQIIQLIQGPIAKSKTIAKCLFVADRIFYLPSCLKSIEQCLNNYLERLDNQPKKQELLLIFSSKKEAGHLGELNNGLSQDDWPKDLVTEKTLSQVNIIWTASLLKWKGLDVLLNALKLFHKDTCPPTSICYIKPSQTNLAVTKTPIKLTNVRWYEQHPNLHEIRQHHSVFISTSENEPFGLAILEAMATGLLVMIPSDGAYWDQVLTHNENCIKYKPNNPVDLKIQIDRLVEHPELIAGIAKGGLQVAQAYQAEKTYRPIADQLAQPVFSPATVPQ
ncbi:glycosyltransferase family 4 protein [Catenovulum sp. SM1970]|uniref:glycosyltransferase family 4 protein n=1 Tax=Marinifaba aquimaris TaxID=2741323 RepID=UPI00157486C0|nr:glycosyltransferase family 4 protein [Marinifaba aquimaris]NTS76173.1 glycosyltransferase family 4 protein [Marinifaba aquimaris]